MMDELPPSYEEASGIPVCSATPFENKGFEENEVAVSAAAPIQNRFVVNEVIPRPAARIENRFEVNEVTPRPAAPIENRFEVNEVTPRPAAPIKNRFEVNEVAVCPAAPFENIGFEENEGFIKPPTAPPFEFQVQQHMPVVDLGSLTADDLREACLEFVSESCCYGSRFVRQTELPEIINMCTYHYQLETFGEKRESIQRTEPFIGQPIDGPENGPPPEPWDVLVPIPEMFQSGQRKVEIPHTAHVRECGRCVGNCRVRCESCRGRGGRSCMSCGGSGRGNSGSCTSCSGSGRRRCWTCSGTGQVKCGTCNGKGRLKHYRLLIVTWTNHIESYITDTSRLPKTLILDASGKEIFKEQNLKVQPINHAQNELVNLASRQMVTKHETAFPQELIKQQKHVLRAVPLTKARFAWKRKTGEFYVYGFQRKVYFENYPQKCCCCTCC